MSDGNMVRGDLFPIECRAGTSTTSVLSSPSSDRAEAPCGPRDNLVVVENRILVAAPQVCRGHRRLSLIGAGENVGGLSRRFSREGRTPTT